MSAILIYISLFIGIFISGEFVFVAAVIAGSQGHYHLLVLLPIAFASTWMSDLLFFQLGRRKGSDWMDKKAAESKRFQSFLKKLDEHENVILVMYRFIFGFRNVLLMLIGSQDIPKRKFYLSSLIATAIWVALYGGLGFLFGKAITRFLNEFKEAEFYIIGVLIAITLVLGIIRFYKRRSV